VASASALGDASPEASADAEAVPCSETWGEALEDLFEEACADAETLADAEAGEELSELGFSVAQALRTRADTATVPKVPRRRDREGYLKNTDMEASLVVGVRMTIFRKIIPCTAAKHLKANTQSWENT
jgi:hypothetical protein